MDIILTPVELQYQAIRRVIVLRRAWSTAKYQGVPGITSQKRCPIFLTQSPVCDVLHLANNLFCGKCKDMGMEKREIGNSGLNAAIESGECFLTYVHHLFIISLYDIEYA